MINTQPAERIVRSEFLDVFEAFHTIQGEGPYAGTPAIFIRLAGCNLQCPLCDTDYTSKREQARARDIVGYCRRISEPLIVITGGEPLRQNLGPLLDELVDYKDVQIETNGTIGQDIRPEVCLVCSPKTTRISAALKDRIDAWKYVVQADCIDPKDGLPTSALGMKGAPARPTNFHKIYIQPCDEEDEAKNKRNLEAAVQSCRQFGHTLCLQLHKIIGLP